ncbi:hypothetical protein MPSEU_000105200 [Mayamaea pseudoterrestris]|nr:hypothetical protein MPSEU_000105200 [Mayamaea pseudoterrestris]
MSAATLGLAGGGSGATSSAVNNQMQQHRQDSSSSPQVLSSFHSDYIYHVSFDTYGRRMATCSGDRFVRVWDLTDTGEWTMSGQYQAHRGSVLSLAWAHPEYGCLLATAGSDQEAKIWEERSPMAVGAGTTTSGNNAASAVSSGRWNLKASLAEARRSVTCLEFSPRHFGLKLAVGSSDGCVRIYEAVDINNLAQWPLAATLECFAETTTHKLGCTSLSWCNGRFEPQTLVAGGSHCVIYRYMESSRAWQAILTLQVPVSGPDHHRPVLDVAWAPNVGRRFHYIASAEGEHIKVFKLLRDIVEDHDGGEGSKEVKTLTLDSTQMVDASAWRCQWNVTGTVLASSGDAGVVQLWKSNSEGQFICVSNVQNAVNP